VFLSGTTYESLVHKLGHKSPQTTKELLDIATNHASGNEAVRAIFDRSRGKVKREEDTSEGGSNCSKKKNKNRQRHDDSLNAAVERKGKRVSTEGTPDHFQKLLEGTCPNHAFPVKHLYKDCGLMKKFLGDLRRGSRRRNMRPRRMRQRIKTMVGTQKRPLAS
jgi:hypothetical protein